MIRFVCTCGRQLQAREADVGCAAICPICGQHQVIPTEPVAIGPTLRRSSPQGASARPAVAQPPLCAAARTSLYLGLSSLVLSLFTGIPAVILGLVALRRIRRGWPPLRGASLAGWGIVTGLIGMCLLTPLVIGFTQTMGSRIQEVASLASPGLKPLARAIDEDEANREASLDNLEELAGAMWEYLRRNGQFPPAALADPVGRPLLSWRVAILPYLNDPEAAELYRAFKLEEPWDGPNNRPLLQCMPERFALPRREAPRGHTYYQVLTGPQTAFEAPRGQPIEDFTDALEETLLIVEAAQAVPWTKPDDLPVTPNGPLPHFGGHYNGGFHAAFADGSVDYLSAGTDARTLWALITRAGGEQIPRP